MKEHCQIFNEEYEARRATRQMETTAVSKAHVLVEVKFKFNFPPLWCYKTPGNRPMSAFSQNFERPFTP